MTFSETWEEWDPIQIAAHVHGRYTVREWDAYAKAYGPQRVEMRCARCGDYRQMACNSGHVRDWIQKYAVVHRHAAAGLK